MIKIPNQLLWLCSQMSCDLNYKFEMIWEETFMAYFKFCSNIHLEIHMEVTNVISII
jgi:hypothetical protein